MLAIYDYIQKRIMVEFPNTLWVLVQFVSLKRERTDLQQSYGEGTFVPL